ncbi:MBL fold metallo-hydrolase [Sciscionella sediminilitoris]|uniref:MBL fold metallo-hydrolase n=1 Tax=Sciscionella sediminilitoris TaxID=1445613 RepID=UPI00068CEF2D|nr:MBL fold metallo-hydrolase [Sciscionella sp. SE31]
MPIVPFTEGLHRLTANCAAWLEPPGGWGLSNSGVVRSGDELLIIDTQNDVPMANRLHAALGSADRVTIVNTHHDIDHWAGNGVFGADRIIATASADFSGAPSPDGLTELARPGTALAEWARRHDETFDYSGWRRVEPNETFTGSLTVVIGDVTVRLIEVGPAHTVGDAIVHIPEHGVVFAGDILFHESTPISWVSVSGQIQACETILSLDPEVVVPGHGPVSDQHGVRAVRDYLGFVHDYASRCYSAGMPVERAYRGIELGAYRAWPHASRVYQNIACVYSELSGEPPLPPAEVMEPIIEGEQE